MLPVLRSLSPLIAVVLLMGGIFLSVHEEPTPRSTLSAIAPTPRIVSEVDRNADAVARRVTLVEVVHEDGSLIAAAVILRDATQVAQGGRVEIPAHEGTTAELDISGPNLPQVRATVELKPGRQTVVVPTRALGGPRLPLQYSGKLNASKRPLLLDW